MLLSVCIPTFERSKYLRELLQSLEEPLKKHASDVEVIVSDNASTDDTALVVAEFARKLPSFRYSRNEQNINGERNFWKCATLAEGRYVWIFGDDDLFYPHALTHLLERLRSDADYYVLNYRNVSNDGSMVTHPPAYSGGDDRQIVDHDDLLRSFGLKMGLISGIVFKRQAFFKVSLSEYLKYEVQGYSFFYLLMLVARRGSRGSYIASPLLMRRANIADATPTPETWSNLYGREIRQLSRDLGTLGYSRAARRDFHAGIVTKFFLFMILGGRLNRIGVRPYLGALVKHYWDVPATWIVLPTALLPARFVVKLRALWRARAARLAAGGA